MSPDNLNATVEKSTTQQTTENPINLADLAADYKVRHPRFSAPADSTKPNVDLTTETIPEPEVPKEEQKLYLTETGSADSTKKTWRDSSYSRLYIMGGVFGVGALALGFMFNMKLPSVRTASVSMSDKPKTEDAKEPEFAGDGEFAAQAALSGQDGAYGTAQNSMGHGTGPTRATKLKPNSKTSPTSRTTASAATAAHTVRMSAPRRASLPPTMAYNPTPARRAYIAPTDDIPASTFRRRPAVPAVSIPVMKSAPAAVSRSAATLPSQPQQSAAERRQAAIAATSTMGGTSDSTKLASVQGTAPVAQSPQTQGYQEAAYLASEDAVLSGIPQQLINRSQKAEGSLLMGVAFIPGDTEALNGQPVEVAIVDPLDSGLPADARIEAVVEFPKAEGQLKSAVIRLTPKAIAIGDAEYPLPPGTVILTGKNGQPLIAKRQGSEFLRAIGSTAKTILGGTIGGLSTLAFGNGTGILSGLGGGLNGLGGLSNLGRTPGTQQATEILALRENTAIQVNIVKPLTLPAIQADSDAVPESVDVAVGQTTTDPASVSPEPPSQPMRFAQTITDAELMAIANEQSAPAQPQLEDLAQPVQPTEVTQPEVQDGQ